ncbi:helix-turn-helix transcriptional regulator [Streptomyces scabiei]|uniref:helix-turn-helix transcriptional regulator n=1 Tax=Streptomyces scabiei TaxID=1930 RepID=UPI0038F6217B
MAEAGFTQTEFSSEIGVSPKYLSAILCERKSPSPKLAKNIACHLHVGPSDIFNYRV